MSDISALPKELLLQVVKCLPSNRDAAAFARSSRSFYSLVNLSTRRKYRRVRLESTEDIYRAVKMLRSILRTPLIGLYVEHIELNQVPVDLDFARFQLPTTEPLLTARELQALKLGVRKAGYEDSLAGEMIIQVLQGDSPKGQQRYGGSEPEDVCVTQALATMVAVMAPNLESLTMSPVGIGWYGRGHAKPYLVFTHFLKRCNRGALPYLQRLRKIEFLEDSEVTEHGGYNERFYQSYDAFAALDTVRKLPSLEAVYFNTICHDGRTVKKLPARSSNYSEIRVEHSLLHGNYHIQMIKSAKRLKAYTFTIGGRVSIDDSICNTYPNGVFRALLLHRHSLEHLNLDMEEDIRTGFMLQCNRLDLGNDSDDEGNDDNDGTEYELSEDSDFGEDLIQNKAQQDAAQPISLKLLSGSLRSFSQLKHLSIGVHLLYHYARGLGEAANVEQPFSLADSLPPKLEFLRIYGYEKGGKGNPWKHDVFGLDDLMARFLRE
ncbi:MAG: hypothetical protein M1822_000502 [Bathelium mastoideum]|nr:MAG: hypothetical protein M1822_000502 [Bathelium mastoideum]